MANGTLANVGVVDCRRPKQRRRGQPGWPGDPGAAGTETAASVGSGDPANTASPARAKHPTITKVTPSDVVPRAVRPLQRRRAPGPGQQSVDPEIRRCCTPVCSTESPTSTAVFPSNVTSHTGVDREHCAGSEWPGLIQAYGVRSIELSVGLVSLIRTALANRYANFSATVSTHANAHKTGTVASSSMRARTRPMVPNRPKHAGRGRRDRGLDRSRTAPSGSVHSSHGRTSAAVPADAARDANPVPEQRDGVQDHHKCGRRRRTPVAGLPSSRGASAPPVVSSSAAMPCRDA
jgi:hypothetical protein